MTHPEDRPLVLVAGASGYVGGRLLEPLLAAGFRVRAMARRPAEFRARALSSIEVVEGDVLRAESLGSALAGVRTAYYLVHSMGKGKDFEALDRIGAENFGRAAGAAGVERIVYLGGLGEENAALSAHLRSRHETGRVLRAGGVPVLEFRASIIVGSGSLSYEMMRALVEKLPVMITPRWVETPAQPIAIEDVIAYLVEAARSPIRESRVFEIGGADRTSYLGMMQEYARQRGLKRFVMRVPVLSPRLSSLWVGLFTPVYAAVGRKLIEGVRNPTVVTDDGALRAFPVRPRGIRESIRRAMSNEERDFAATRWTDALSSFDAPTAYGGVRFGTRLVDSRAITVHASASEAFAPIRRIGGRNGWYFGDALWKLRGFVDIVVGGPGMRRGRRDPERLVAGDTVDCWRVETVEPDRLLRLRAEMKLPGRAWLQFEVEGEDPAPRIRQTAIFDARGLFGLLYWYGIWPLHGIVFGGMLRALAKRAEAERGAGPKDEGPAAPGAASGARSRSEP